MTRGSEKNGYITTETKCHNPYHWYTFIYTFYITICGRPIEQQLYKN